MATSDYDVDYSRAAWRKSTRSSGNGECVEATTIVGAIAVRDSKHPDGPKLLLTPHSWTAFVWRIKTERSAH
jgi:Domain of unknown function (DUF397)